MMHNQSIFRPLRHMVFLGLLLAMASALSFLEGLIPPLPAMPPGVKLGLSNIVTMYTLFFMGPLPALTVTVLKSGFVLLTRGLTAAALSVTGGLFSLLVMLLLLAVGKRRISYFIVSVFGAVFHNLGQLAAASLFTGTTLIFAYVPVLIVSGVVMGVVTGTVLKIVLPALERLQLALFKSNPNRKGDEFVRIKK